MPETGSTFGDWFAPATDRAWRAAWAEARNLGHAWFGTEHLLLGLLHGPADDPAVRALSTQGVTLESVHAVLVADLHGPLIGDDASLLATLGVNLAEVRARIEASLGPDAIDELYDRRRRGGRRLARGPLCGIGMMPRAKQALEQARRAANTEHRPLATTTDLLLGILEVRDGLAVQLLRTLGIDTDTLRGQLRPRAAG
jgi:ATP-dependent Clp protease ATP-binding subunit ClpA